MGTKTATGVEAEYFSALEEGRFLIQHCPDCDGYVFYPRQICAHCGSEAVAFVEAKGTGTVHSTTVVRRKPEFGGDINVALVELDEGPRMMSRVEGIGPADVRIGMRVSARVARPEDKAVVVFDVVES